MTILRKTMSSFAMCNSLQAFKTEMFLEFDISIL